MTEQLDSNNKQQLIVLSLEETIIVLRIINKDFSEILFPVSV